MREYRAWFSFYNEEWGNFDDAAYTVQADNPFDARKEGWLKWNQYIDSKFQSCVKLYAVTWKPNLLDAGDYFYACAADIKQAAGHIENVEIPNNRLEKGDKAPYYEMQKQYNLGALHTVDSIAKELYADSIRHRYGEIDHIEYLVRDEQGLRSNLRNLAHDFWQAAEPADIDDYIREMVDERFKTAGYTLNDMAYISGSDAFDALKRQIPVWLLSSTNRREEIKTVDELQGHMSQDRAVGIEKEHRRLLDYMKKHPQRGDGLFNHAELKKILFLSLIAGKDEKTSPNDLKTLQSILYKLDKACFTPVPQCENARDCIFANNMGDAAAEDEAEP